MSSVYKGFFAGFYMSRDKHFIQRSEKTSAKNTYTPTNSLSTLANQSRFQSVRIVARKKLRFRLKNEKG